MFDWYNILLNIGDSFVKHIDNAKKQKCHFTLSTIGEGKSIKISRVCSFVLPVESRVYYWSIRQKKNNDIFIDNLTLFDRQYNVMYNNILYKGFNNIK